MSITITRTVTQDRIYAKTGMAMYYCFGCQDSGQYKNVDAIAFAHWYANRLEHITVHDGLKEFASLSPTV